MNTFDLWLATFDWQVVRNVSMGVAIGLSAFVAFWVLVLTILGTLFLLLKSAVDMIRKA